MSRSVNCLLYNIRPFWQYFHEDAKLGCQLSICTEKFSNWSLIAIFVHKLNVRLKSYLLLSHEGINLHNDIWKRDKLNVYTFIRYLIVNNTSIMPYSCWKLHSFFPVRLSVVSRFYNSDFDIGIAYIDWVFSISVEWCKVNPMHLSKVFPLK